MCNLLLRFHHTAQISYLTRQISANDLRIPYLHNGSGEAAALWSFCNKPLWSAYPPLPPPFPLLFMNGQIWHGADHMILVLKTQQRNVDRTPPPSKNPPNTLMPHIIRNTLSAPVMCSDAVEGSSQGGGGGVGTDSGYVWSEGRQPLAGVERCLAKRPGSYLITWRGSGPFSHN